MREHKELLRLCQQANTTEAAAKINAGLSEPERREIAWLEGRSEGKIAGLKAALRVIPNQNETQGRVLGTVLKKLVAARKAHRRNFPLSESRT
ncbi:MAG: hypothetical protein IPK72_21205 [Candidatus Eisenbacteria bacterium]|nr:hypothetical protein [Candidatus Eisenbacteria bacterium]